MKEHAYEVFEKINNAKTEEERTNLLTKYGKLHPFNLLLSLNFDKKINLDLPEGPPPYKRDETVHPDLFGSSLAQNMRRLVPLMKGYQPQIQKSRREHVFIQILEAIPPKEADILIFVKDGALEELYPNITRELVKSIFPNYCRD